LFDINSKFRTVATFVIISMLVTFVIYLLTNFHISRSNGSLVRASKLITKYEFRTKAVI